MANKRLPANKRRVPFTTMVDPKTVAELDAIAKSCKLSRGRVIDALVGVGNKSINVSREGWGPR